MVTVDTWTLARPQLARCDRPHFAGEVSPEQRAPQTAEIDGPGPAPSSASRSMWHESMSSLDHQRSPTSLSRIKARFLLQLQGSDGWADLVHAL